MFVLISLVTVLAGYFLGRWSLFQDVKHQLCLTRTALQTCELYAQWIEASDDDVRVNIARAIDRNATHMMEELRAAGRI